MTVTATGTFIVCDARFAGHTDSRAASPSRLSLLGPVRHMVEVERW